jgi:hypothetical protein
MMELSGVYWSDWGSPERIRETMALMGRGVHSAKSRGDDFISATKPQPVGKFHEKLAAVHG